MDAKGHFHSGSVLGQSLLSELFRAVAISSNNRRCGYKCFKLVLVAQDEECSCLLSYATLLCLSGTKQQQQVIAFFSIVSNKIRPESASIPRKSGCAQKSVISVKQPVSRSEKWWESVSLGHSWSITLFKSSTRCMGLGVEGNQGSVDLKLTVRLLAPVFVCICACKWTEGFSEPLL